MRFIWLIVVVMRYAVKIINLILADICPATKLNNFHLGYFPIYLSYNTCKFVFFELSAVYYQDYNTSNKKLCKEDMYVCPLNRDI